MVKTFCNFCGAEQTLAKRCSHAAMTPREPLTRYVWSPFDMIEPAPGADRHVDRYVRLEDVLARDQAREAEIRALIAEWITAADFVEQRVKHLHATENDCLAKIIENDADRLRSCAERLEPLLTPPQEREGR
jgi:hypothetical protein